MTRHIYGYQMTENTHRLQIESEESEYNPLSPMQCNDSMPSRKHGIHGLLNQIIEQINNIDKRLAAIQYHTQTIKLVQYTGSEEIPEDPVEGAV